MPSPLRTSYCLLLLAAFWAALYLPALGKRELQGEEARRVLPGRTMLQNGDWMLPRSGGAIYNRKPPLVNWVSAGAISLSGTMDEWTVRLPSTLMMLALGVGMFCFLRGWQGNDQALLTSLIALTTIGFLEKGRLIEIEALYMSLFGIALAAWLGLRWQHKDLAAWMISGLVLGLGFLAKGPVHVLYFYALVIGVLAAEKRLKELWQWKHFAGLACFFAVWVPWAILNSQRNTQRDSGKVWAEQITHRLGFVEFDFVNYLLQVPQSLVNFLPWALLLPLCWRVRYEDDRHGQWIRGLRKGLLWAFFVVALLPSSRPRFMLPLNAAAALLVADALVRLSAERFGVIARRWRLGLLLLGALATIALVLSPWTQARGSSAWGGLHWLGWGLWLVVLADAWRLLMRSPWSLPRTLGWTTALVMGASVSALSFQIVSRQPWGEELRTFAAQVEDHTGPDEPILLFKVGERMWPFYLGLRCREAADVESLPEGMKFRWMIVARKAWDKDSTRKNLTRLYGSVRTERPLKEPQGKDEYVLVETYTPMGATQGRASITSEESLVDTSEAMAIFTGAVVLKSPLFNLTTDGVLEVHLKREAVRGMKAPAARDMLLDALSGGPNTGGNPIEFAIARGQAVTVEKFNGEGALTLGTSRQVRYDAGTGDLLLGDEPRVQSKGNLLIATDARTTMILSSDGKVKVNGITRTDIIDKALESTGKP